MWRPEAWHSSLPVARLMAATSVRDARSAGISAINSMFLESSIGTCPQARSCQTAASHSSRSRHHHHGRLTWTEPVKYWRKACLLACLVFPAVCSRLSLSCLIEILPGLLVDHNHNPPFSPLYFLPALSSSRGYVFERGTIYKRRSKVEGCVVKKISWISIVGIATALSGRRRRS